MTRLNLDEAQQQNVRPTIWNAVGRYVVPTILSTLLMTVGAAIAWGTGQVRSDSTQESEIKALQRQQEQLRKDVDGRLTKEEFQQFVKGLDDRLLLIQKNTELMLENQKKDKR